MKKSCVCMLVRILKYCGILCIDHHALWYNLSKHASSCSLAPKNGKGSVGSKLLEQLRRDVKPENLLLTLNRTESTENMPLRPHLRLIDFGSAVDSESFKKFYGSEGPSEREQTHEYTPPEMLLAR